MFVHEHFIHQTLHVFFADLQGACVHVGMWACRSLTVVVYARYVRVCLGCDQG